MTTATSRVSSPNDYKVYIYDHKTSDLYVHHEFILAAHPLCMEWIPTFEKKKVNLLAVGTFVPAIEIWDLNSEDSEPVCVLGDA